MPPASVTDPAPTDAPVQALDVVKNVKVTVPVGVPKLPLTVALSCTVVPAGTDVTTASAASWISVTTLVGTSILLLVILQTMFAPAATLTEMLVPLPLATVFPRPSTQEMLLV